MNPVKKKVGILLMFWSLMVHYAYAQDQTDDEVYLFSYFRDNGQDGLHLAYSDDGYTWHALKQDRSFLKPTAGNDKLMRDPCIIRGKDNQYHMVWTVSWNEKGIGYASSSDLVNWSSQRYIPVMEHEPNARNCWAPEIFYDDKQKEYVIYWATTITGLFPETQSVKENAYNHRMYYVTTKDFKTFSKAALMYEPGFNVIDATLLKHGKRYYMFLKDETIEPAQKNIRVAVSKKASHGFGKPSAPITGNYWAEGPTAIHVSDAWMVYFDKYRDHRMGAVTSSDLKNWRDVSGAVSFPKGVRHGSAFKITRKEFENLLDKIKDQ